MRRIINQSPKDSAAPPNPDEIGQLFVEGLPTAVFSLYPDESIAFLANPSSPKQSQQEGRVDPRSFLARSWIGSIDMEDSRFGLRLYDASIDPANVNRDDSFNLLVRAATESIHGSDILYESPSLRFLALGIALGTISTVRIHEVAHMTGLTSADREIFDRRLEYLAESHRWIAYLQRTVGGSENSPEQDKILEGLFSRHTTVSEDAACAFAGLAQRHRDAIIGELIRRTVSLESTLEERLSAHDKLAVLSKFTAQIVEEEREAEVKAWTSGYLPTWEKELLAEVIVADDMLACGSYIRLLSKCFIDGDTHEKTQALLLMAAIYRLNPFSRVFIESETRAARATGAITDAVRDSYEREGELQELARFLHGGIELDQSRRSFVGGEPSIALTDQIRTAIEHSRSLGEFLGLVDAHGELARKVEETLRSNDWREGSKRKNFIDNAFDKGFISEEQRLLLNHPKTPQDVRLHELLVTSLMYLSFAADSLAFAPSKGSYQDQRRFLMGVLPEVLYGEANFLRTTNFPHTMHMSGKEGISDHLNLHELAAIMALPVQERRAAERLLRSREFAHSDSYICEGIIKRCDSSALPLLVALGERVNIQEWYHKMRFGRIDELRRILCRDRYFYPRLPMKALLNLLASETKNEATSTIESLVILPRQVGDRGFALKALENHGQLTPRGLEHLGELLTGSDAADALGAFRVLKRVGVLALPTFERALVQGSSAIPHFDRQIVEHLASFGEQGAVCVFRACLERGFSDSYNPLVALYLKDTKDASYAALGLSNAYLTKEHSDQIYFGALRAAMTHYRLEPMLSSPHKEAFPGLIQAYRDILGS